MNWVISHPPIPLLAQLQHLINGKADCQHSLLLFPKHAASTLHEGNHKGAVVHVLIIIWILQCNPANLEVAAISPALQSSPNTSNYEQLLDTFNCVCKVDPFTKQTPSQERPHQNHQVYWVLTRNFLLIPYYQIPIKCKEFCCMHLCLSWKALPVVISKYDVELLFTTKN